MPCPKTFPFRKEEDMVAAVDGVKSGELSKSSLANRVVGKVEPGAKSRPNTLLIPEDEKKTSGVFDRYQEAGVRKK